MFTAPPAILESGVFKTIPLWLIVTFLGGAFVLIISIYYLFFAKEQTAPRIERKQESPQKVLEGIKKKYGMTPQKDKGITWTTIFFAFLFLIFLILAGFLLGGYLKEGEPKGEEFVAYVQRAFIWPIRDNILSFFKK